MTMHSPATARNERAADTLAAMLERYTGQLLTEGRRWRVETSLRPLLREHGIPTLDDLVVRLGANPAGPLFDQTIDLMLNHESSFFRDLTVFQSLEKAILPELRERAGDKRLRIWCAGCATGKEAYSVAMALKHMGDMWDGWRISITATDVSPISIQQAKRGLYSQMEMQRGLAISDLLRWFDPVGPDWQIKDELRAMVSFHADNLLAPKAISGEYDLILCRNVLFYFQNEQRGTAFAQLARHAHEGTYLVLGAGETLVGQETSFTPSRDHRCVYRCETPAIARAACGARQRG